MSSGAVSISVVVPRTASTLAEPDPICDPAGQTGGTDPVAAVIVLSGQVGALSNVKVGPGGALITSSPSGEGMPPSVSLMLVLTEKIPEPPSLPLMVGEAVNCSAASARAGSAAIAVATIAARQLADHGLGRRVRGGGVTARGEGSLTGWRMDRQDSSVRGVTSRHGVADRRLDTIPRTELFSIDGQNEPMRAAADRPRALSRPAAIVTADAEHPQGEAVHPFDRATALQALSKSSLPFGAAATGARGYAALVDECWWDEREVNAGYLAALVLRGMSEAVGSDAGAARSMTVHFSRAARSGPARLFAVNEASQPGLAHASARLEQDHRPVAVALASFSRTGPDGGHRAVMPRDGEDVEPGAAEPATWARWRQHPPAYLSHYELRPQAAAAERHGASTAGWVRLAGPPARPLDALSLSAFAAAWMPGPLAQVAGADAADTLSLSVSFPGLGPTAELAEDRCLGVWRWQGAGEGLYEEDGELWSPGGRLLVRSRLVGRYAAPVPTAGRVGRRPSVEVG